MIYIDLENEEFYDDAQVLVKSFYPGVKTAIKKSQVDFEPGDTVVAAEVPDCERLGKKEAHDCFKRELYLKLSDETGKTLPWGYLTGVRPSKIAYSMLEAGFDEADILREFEEKHFVSHGKARLALKVAETERAILDRLDYRSGYSLYIGIPFCPTTCLYCSFTSYSLEANRSRVEDYLDALIKELAFVSDTMSQKRLDTVYIGGGTPTTLNPTQLDRLLTELEALFDMKNVREFTVEAGRPDSVTREKLRVLKAHGVGRISINPQTMNDKTLEIIGRRHSAGQVEEAFRLAREEGFDNINMDIILGLPGEGKEEVRATLERISALSPESLTVHSLALKRAAALNIWREKYRDLKFENSDEIVSLAASYAKKMGCEPYYMYRQKNMAGNLENVGYAKPGLESIYNILIMEEKQTIIACGAGASSKIVFNGSPDDNTSDRIERIENVKDLKSYIERIDEMILRKKNFFQNK